MARPDATRATAPVLIVGSPRSGTTWLHHLLQSANGFVYFRTENHLFTGLTPHFGDLRRAGRREALVDFWLRSEHFRLTGLEAAGIRRRVSESIRTAADFLQLVMTLMAERQGAVRWVDSTPGHALHLPDIRRDLPGALVIHVIRDGRSTALSMARQRWIAPLPGDDDGLIGAAAHWAFHVRTARRHAPILGERYLEIRYESLVEDIRGTLRQVGAFIGQDLDYDDILSHPVGSVTRPNSSFAGAALHEGERWRPEDEASAQRLEGVLARDLTTLGYPRRWDMAAAPRDAALLAAYHAKQALGLFLKRRTVLGRRTSLGLFQPTGKDIPEEKRWWPDGRHRRPLRDAGATDPGP